ncbi:hypothetical protein D3C85_425790 [compost metagenome]
MDMLERTPVEILAADVRHLAIDGQVFRVHDAIARHLIEIDEAQVQVRDRLDLRDGGRFRQAHALLVQQEADFYTALAGGRQAGQHLFKGRARFADGVELGDDDLFFCRIEQFGPHGDGLAQVGIRQARFHGRRVHELKSGNGEIRVGRAREQAGQNYRNK